MKSLVLGVAGATVFPALALVVYTFVAAKFWPSSFDDLIGTGVLLATALVFSLIGVVALGLPLILWLRGRGWLTWTRVVLGSVTAGAIYLAALSFALTWEHHLPPVQQLGPGALLGLLSGIGFCLGAGPNNSFKSKPLRGST